MHTKCRFIKNKHESVVAELEGAVTIEHLFRYIKLHFEVHAGQIRERLG